MIESLRSLAEDHRPAYADMWRPASASPAAPKKAALGYEAASSGRRAKGWKTTADGINSILFSDLERLRERARDAVRKNPWAGNAIDSFVGNAVGNGIKPQFLHPDAEIRDGLQKAWLRWTDEADACGQSDFYGMQALIARSSMEAGECFLRFRDRRPEDGLSVPLQLQLMESEQLPVYASTLEPTGPLNKIRLGIEFDALGRRAAYHFYKTPPNETIFTGFSQEVVRIPAEQILHAFIPLRSEQVRGVPKLAPVLARLYELDHYDDATLVRQKVASMFAFFVETDTADGVSGLPEETTDRAELVLSGIEPGTGQIVPPGKKITFADPPDLGSYRDFMKVQLRSIAAGVGITYEQLTGDLEGVNYSSIRAGLLEFRRRCEQYQYQSMAFQVLRPIAIRWVQAAVLAGAIRSPKNREMNARARAEFAKKVQSDFADDPYEFGLVRWVTPGWPWVDPLKDVTASVMEIRSGLASRGTKVSEKGEDVEQIDRDQVADNKRVDELGLSYDSDGRRPETQRAADSRGGVGEAHQRELDQQQPEVIQ